MLELTRESIRGQYEAALSMLRDAIVACPEDRWSQHVASHTFSQSAFHTLFFTDLYLGDGIEHQQQQDFHQQRQDFFGEYEELEDVKPSQHYEKQAILAYLDFCRAKMLEVLAAEDEASLAAAAPFSWLEISRLELHSYNLRHVQHHAGQLILRRRLDEGAEFSWCRSGWRGP